MLDLMTGAASYFVSSSETQGRTCNLTVVVDPQAELHRDFDTTQTLIREGSPLVKLRNSA